MTDVTDADRLALAQLTDLARCWEGTFSLTAIFSPNATRYPEPDWAVNLIYLAVAAEAPHAEPAGVFGVGATIADAVQHALGQLPQPPDTGDPT